jgi:class 3 adenylate cyclase
MSKPITRHVTPELAKLLRELPNFCDGPVEMRGAVLVARIAGFQRLAAPERYPQLSASLNAYFTCLSEAIHPHRGDLQAAIGSRVQAGFGFLFRRDAESAPRDALRAALAILHRDPAAEPLNSWLREAGAGIALSMATGTCLVGNFGSETRQFLMAVGEPAECAAALCDAAGSGELLLDAETLAAARQADPAVISERELQPRRVTGQQVYAIRQAWR